MTVSIIKHQQRQIDLTTGNTVPYSFLFLYWNISYVRERERGRGRETDRQTDTERQRQTDRQRLRKKDREKREETTLLHKDTDLRTSGLFYKFVPDDKQSNTQ